MKLKDIFPIFELRELFKSETVVAFLTLNDIDEIADLEPISLFEIGANSWMRYVESGADVNPKLLMDHFDNYDKFLYREVEKVIGEKIIKDILLVKAKVDDKTLKHNVCAELLVANINPNRLHISDVAFGNPYFPIKRVNKKYITHEFKSLGLFKILFNKIVQYCRVNNVSVITLTASLKEQVSYFQTYGFNVENTDYAKRCLKIGSGIPMEKILF